MYLHSQLKIIKKSNDGRMAEWLMFGTANPATPVRFRVRPPLTLS